MYNMGGGNVADGPSHALLFGAQKLNLHVASRPWEPHAQTPAPGSADLCFLTDSPADAVAARLHTLGIEVLEGGAPVARVGAVGRLTSVYVRDPDGNLVE
jgi:catechol 2,3-dioxygenase-like lactoylglutathione lyase family enzyme